MIRRTLVLLLLPLMAFAAPETPKSFDPPLAPASDEAKKAIPRFKHAASLKVDVWASEPMLAHPVAFCLDEKGQVYVAETFRHSAGVTDNRSHMYWLDDELAARTVEDRVALYRNDKKGKFADYETQHDRVRMIVDKDGDHKADVSTVFADGFNKAEDGIGSGLLARKGDVFYTCIPHLWKLRDNDGDGKAEVRESLSYGYGVHVAFIGHDLHGLRMGPDGKLYFTIGDRGLNVKTREGKELFYPDTGAVLRCDTEGRNLEVVHSGLRNPQELAFDDYGNLFTVDNNSDAGDKARFVNIVEGGDSGWRLGYQYGSSLSDRGPWHAEKIWHTPHAGQPANIIPPLRHFADGPSGFTHYPGIGLEERYNGHFFLADFRGASNGSGIRSFSTKPKGASYEMTDDHQFIWSVLATDCDFGPDGAFYLSDWVEGWNLNKKGRIYRVTDAEAMKNPAVPEAKELLAKGFDHRSIDELIKLLGHPHQQVRLESQFALAQKTDGIIEPLCKVMKADPNRLARIHAIWTLKQARAQASKLGSETLLALTNDPDAEIRIQVAKAWEGITNIKPLIAMLKDADLRVRLNAALTLAKRTYNDFESQTVGRAAIELLRDNADKDAYLRHGGVMALASLKPEFIESIAGKDASPSVRLGAVLALRRHKSPKLADFLNDADERVITETVRAIHDELVMDAFPQIAAMSQRSNLPEMVGYRVLNANFRLGQPEHAVALAKFAALPDAKPTLRIEALRMLGDWEKPGRRDRVTGLTQNLPARSADVAANALKPSLGGIFTSPPNVRTEAAKIAAKLGVREVGPTLIGLINDESQTGSSRADALVALDSLKDARLSDAVTKAIASKEPQLRNAGRRILAKTKPDDVVKLLAAVLVSDAPIVERQGAITLLGEIATESADAELNNVVGSFRKDNLSAELHLDLLEALAKRKSNPVIAKSLSLIEEKRSKDDKLAMWREVLVGGDAEAGRRVFLYKSEVSCLRCHKVQGNGGEVGPDVTAIGTKQKRDYLLEAIVLPNAQIAKGFDSVTLFLNNGKSVSGVLKGETDSEVKIVTAEGQPLTIRKADIDERQVAKSAMPEDVLKYLSKRELRDLVEFLATVK